MAGSGWIFQIVPDELLEIPWQGWSLGETIIIPTL